MFSDMLRVSTDVTSNNSRHWLPPDWKGTSIERSPDLKSPSVTFNNRRYAQILFSSNFHRTVRVRICLLFGAYHANCRLLDNSQSGFVLRCSCKTRFSQCNSEWTTGDLNQLSAFRRNYIYSCNAGSVSARFRLLFGCCVYFADDPWIRSEGFT